jgi:hypothetical protein
VYLVFKFELNVFVLSDFECVVGYDDDDDEEDKIRANL